MDSALFLGLSVDLVGDPDLDPHLAESLMQRLLAAADPSTVQRLQGIAEELPGEPTQRVAAIGSQIMNDAALRELAKSIIVLWYTGNLLNDNAGTIPEEHYFAAQMWPVARAHPPGLSGGYYGHWTYPPDN